MPFRPERPRDISPGRSGFIGVALGSGNGQVQALKGRNKMSRPFEDGARVTPYFPYRISTLDMSASDGKTILTNRASGGNSAEWKTTGVQ